MDEQRRAGVRTVAVAGPVIVAAVASVLGDWLANTSAALVLVLAVAAVGVVGDRVAGVLAALSAAAAFDFFLTVPYYGFSIHDRDDVETAVLLLAVGVAVTEIAQWGRRHQSRSARRSGYLTGVAHAARMAADGSPTTDLAATVARMIRDVLDLDDCRFDAPVSAGQGSTDRPLLGRDGAVTWGGRTVDIPREGLPTMDVVELPAGRAEGGGRFLLTASTRVRRPDREQLLVAVTLAEQLSATAVGQARPASRD